MGGLFVIAGILVAAIAGHAFLSEKPILGMLFGFLAVSLISRIKSPPFETTTDIMLTIFAVILIASAAVTFFSLKRSHASDNALIKKEDERTWPN